MRNKEANKTVNMKRDMPQERAEKSSFLQILSERVNTLCEAALFLTLTGMTLVTLLQIVCRIWFRALTWSEELTCFLLVYASFIGCTVAFKRGANIAVTFLLDILPGPARRAVRCEILLVGMAFFAVTAWYGYILCRQEWTQMASALPISMSWMYMVFPLTGTIVILHLTAQMQALFTAGENGREAAS